MGPFKIGKYILTYIDLFNKKGVSRKLKDKFSRIIINVLDYMIQKEGRQSEIFCSNRKESSIFKGWCNKNDNMLKYRFPYTIPTSTDTINRPNFDE